MKKIACLLIALISVLGLVACDNSNNKNVSNEVNQGNTNINETQKEESSKKTVTINTEKRYETLFINDIKIVEEDVDKNVLYATAKNDSVADFYETEVDVELYNAAGESIGIVGAIIPEIKPGETAEIKVSIPLNVMNTKDIEIKAPLV